MFLKTTNSVKIINGSHAISSNSEKPEIPFCKNMEVWIADKIQMF